MNIRCCRREIGSRLARHTEPRRSVLYQSLGISISSHQAILLCILRKPSCLLSTTRLLACWREARVASASTAFVKNCLTEFLTSWCLLKPGSLSVFPFHNNSLQKVLTARVLNQGKVDFASIISLFGLPGFIRI